MPTGVTKMANKSQHRDRRTIILGIGEAICGAGVHPSRPLEAGIAVKKRESWGLNTNVSYKQNLIVLIQLVGNLRYRR